MLCNHCGAENMRIKSPHESFVCYECGDWNESSIEDGDDEEDTNDEDAEWVWVLENDR